jgi:hypothetical protein
MIPSEISPPTTAPRKPKKRQPVPTRTSAATQEPPFQGYLTPAQQLAQARREAEAKILPQQQTLTREQAAIRGQAGVDEATARETAAALAQLLKGIGPATQQPYLAAAGADAAFAKGFSTGLERVQGQTRDEAAGLLAASGGQGQQPMIDQAAGGANVTDALYQLGGYIPASSMNREGAGFAAAAANLPATALLTGRQDVQGIKQAATADEAKIRGKLADLAARVPALFDTSLGRIEARQGKLASDAQAQALRERTQSFRESEADRDYKFDERQQDAREFDADRDFKFDLAKFGEEAALDRQRLRLDVDYKNAQLAQSDRRIRLEAARVRNSELKAAQLSAPKFHASNSRAQGYRSDQYGNPLLSKKGNVVPLPGYKIGPDGAVTKTSSSRGAKGPFTRKQTLAFRGDALNLAELAFNGAPATDDDDELPPLSYEEALMEGEKAGIPRSILVAALNRFYVPGDRGRPQTKVTQAGLDFFNTLSPPWQPVG